MADQMGRAGWERVRCEHTPELHYQNLMSHYERLVGEKHQTSGLKVSHAEAAEMQKPRLRVAFICGRGVISKCSGIESYYEEVGKRLAAMGHEVTIYCRNYFTPDLAEHNGMKPVRLLTVRSKHLETVIHSSLSTLHTFTGGYDLVHYHSIGSALFSSCHEYLAARRR